MRFLQPRAQSKVAKLEMTACIEQKIVGFDVSVDETESVYRVDRKRCFHNVKLRAFFAQRVFFHEQRHHVTASEEFHD